MKVMNNICSIFLILMLSACSESGIEITQQQFSEKWPFTVTSGRIECKNNAVIFHSQGQSYAVNGVAKQNVYSAIEPIWKKDPSFLEIAKMFAEKENKPVAEVIKEMGSPTRINIGPILNYGLQLCN